VSVVSQRVATDVQGARAAASSPKLSELFTVLRRLGRLLTWKRACVYALPVILLYVAAWGYSFIGAQAPLNARGVPIGGDYIAFHTAGRLLLLGGGAHIYDRTTVIGIQDQLLEGRAPGFYDAFRNPPFFALPFVPLALWDLIPAYVLWTLASLTCLALALWLLLRDVPELRSRWPGLAILVFAFPPTIIGLLDGQNSTFSLLLFVLIYRSLLRGQDGAIGVWAALGLFKPQLFLVFPIVFIASRRWRSLAAYALTAALLSLISVALVGVDGTIDWFRIVVDMEPGNAAANAWRMHSLKTFFDLLFAGQTQLALAAYGLSTLGLLGLLAWVWTRSAELDARRLWALTLLIGVMIDPHIVEYDLLVLIPAGIFLAMLVPWSRWTMLGFLPLTLVRVTPTIGESVIQLTVIVLLCWAAALISPLLPRHRRSLTTAVAT